VSTASGSRTIMILLPMTFMKVFTTDLGATLKDGKDIVEWLEQYANNDKRFKACLDVLLESAKN